MPFPRPPRATAPPVRDAALQYLEKKQQDNTNNGDANNGDANNGNTDANNGNNNNNNNNANGGNATPTASGNSTVSAGAGGNSTNSSSISIPQTAAAGGITLLQPPQSGSASYFKIAPSETITFKWNMTALYVQPKSLTVIASCADNGNTYPVGPTGGNQNVFDGNTTEVAWCPYEWAQVPGQPAFAAASYTLNIWDERGPGTMRQGGWLQPYAGYKFGMYIPQAYTPLADWTCATCSSATRLLDQPAGLSIMMSFIVMIISAYAVLRR